MGQALKKYEDHLAQQPGSDANAAGAVTPVTEQQTLVSLLNDAMDEDNLSIAVVAKSIGKSRSLLSSWLSGSYTGDVDQVARLVTGFLARRQQARTARRAPEGFIDTMAWHVFLPVAEACHATKKMGVVYGESGLGKTECVREYCRRNSDVILIEADDSYTSRTLMREIHRAAGFEGMGTIYDMSRDIIARMGGVSGRLIIVDEAEKLPYRALELLRRIIYDKAGVSVLLVGTPVLISNLRGSRGEYAQLYNRVNMARRIKGMEAEDVRSFVARAHPGQPDLWEQYAKGAKDLRTLHNLIEAVYSISSGADISPAHIKRAMNMIIL